MPRRFRRPDYYYSFYREPCSDHVFVCVGGPQSTSRKQFGKPRFYERRSVDAACTRAAHENTSQKSVRSPAQKYQLVFYGFGIINLLLGCYKPYTHTRRHLFADADVLHRSSDIITLQYLLRARFGLQRSFPALHVPRCSLAYLLEPTIGPEHLDAPAVRLHVTLDGGLVKVEVIAGLLLAELPELVSGCQPHALRGGRCDHREKRTHNTRNQEWARNAAVAILGKGKLRVCPRTKKGSGISARCCGRQQKHNNMDRKQGPSLRTSNHKKNVWRCRTAYCF